MRLSQPKMPAPGFEKYNRPIGDPQLQDETSVQQLLVALGGRTAAAELLRSAMIEFEPRI
jgi:hypothetical protein